LSDVARDLQAIRRHQPRDLRSGAEVADHDGARLEPLLGVAPFVVQRGRDSHERHGRARVRDLFAPLAQAARPDRPSAHGLTTTTGEAPPARGFSVAGLYAGM